MGAMLALGVGRIVGVIATAVTSWSYLLVFLMVTVLPILIYNVASEIFGELLAFASSKVAELTGDLAGSPLQFVGVGAFLADCLRVPDQISIVLAMVGLKWQLMKIPFFKW